MTRLEAAKARLANALDALEKSVRANDTQISDLPENFSELDQLRNERGQLLGRIAALEDETQELATLTEEMEGRLNGAIAELRDVLGRN
jgi:chromosome segregation ATPase